MVGAIAGWWTGLGRGCGQPLRARTAPAAARAVGRLARPGARLAAKAAARARVRAARRAEFRQDKEEPAELVDLTGFPRPFCRWIRNCWVRVWNVFSCRLQTLAQFILTFLLSEYHTTRPGCKPFCSVRPSAAPATLPARPMHRRCAPRPRPSRLGTRTTGSGSRCG
jgi:hypothetical protein